MIGHPEARSVGAAGGPAVWLAWIEIFRVYVCAHEPRIAPFEGDRKVPLSLHTLFGTRSIYSPDPAARRSPVYDPMTAGVPRIRTLDQIAVNILNEMTAFLWEIMIAIDSRGLVVLAVIGPTTDHSLFSWQTTNGTEGHCVV